MIDSLLSALGYAGEAIDKPGRAIRGLLAGRPDEAAAAIPFSDSLGLTDQSRSTSGKDLLSALGLDLGDGIGADAAGFGAEVATDPLTLLGAGAGVRLGRAAEKAAVARGPQFATTADDFLRAVGGDISPMAAWGVDSVSTPSSRLMNSPNIERILSELDPGSKYLGQGVEGMAFKTPAGTVTRIGESPGALGRPISPNVAQPTSTVDFPDSLWRVERGLPYADRVNDVQFWTKRDPADAMFDRSGLLDQALAGSGLRRQDRHLGNVGMVGDTPMVIDPGDIRAMPGFSGGYQEVTTARDPGVAMNALLDALGSSQTIRAGLDPEYRALLGIAGGGGGAVAGASGRAFGK